VRASELCASAPIFTLLRRKTAAPHKAAAKMSLPKIAPPTRVRQTTHRSGPQMILREGKTEVDHESLF
jgi:hypothetical protein